MACEMPQRGVEMRQTEFAVQQSGGASKQAGSMQEGEAESRKGVQVECECTSKPTNSLQPSQRKQCARLPGNQEMEGGEGRRLNQERKKISNFELKSRLGAHAHVCAHGNPGTKWVPGDKAWGGWKARLGHGTAKP